MQRRGHRSAATPLEPSAAAVESQDTGQAALEKAALAYARELPSVVARAIRRAARGKPTPLLRSLTRILRETGALLDANADKKARTPKPHPQLGVLTPFEFEILAGNLQFLRASQSNADYLEDLQAKNRGEPLPHTPDPPPLPQTTDELPHLASAEQLKPEPPPWNGVDRRQLHMRGFCAGIHERRGTGRYSNRPGPPKY